MTVFSSAYFHPYDYMSGEAVLTDRTISIHHFNGGWLDESSKKSKRKDNTRISKSKKQNGTRICMVVKYSNNSNL